MADDRLLSQCNYCKNDFNSRNTRSIIKVFITEFPNIMQLIEFESRINFTNLNFLLELWRFLLILIGEIIVKSSGYNFNFAPFPPAQRSVNTQYHLFIFGFRHYSDFCHSLVRWMIGSLKSRDKIVSIFKLYYFCKSEYVSFVFDVENPKENPGRPTSVSAKHVQNQTWHASIKN